MSTSCQKSSGFFANSLYNSSINKEDGIMRIEVKDGVIRELHVQTLDVTLADKIAKANGFQHAEEFVKKYSGQRLQLHNDFTVHFNLY